MAQANQVGTFTKDSTKVQVTLIYHEIGCHTYGRKH